MELQKIENLKHPYSNLFNYDYNKYQIVFENLLFNYVHNDEICDEKYDTSQNIWNIKELKAMSFNWTPNIFNKYNGKILLITQTVAILYTIIDNFKFPTL